jgi:hypothetical protein
MVAGAKSMWPRLWNIPGEFEDLLRNNVITR